MQFTTGTVTACSGGEHLTLPVTTNGTTRPLNFTRDELKGSPLGTAEDKREAVLARLRIAVLESTTGVPTIAQVRAAIENKTFEV